MNAPILVVDDESETLRSVVSQLTRAGLDAVPAAGGREALAVAAALAPAAAVIDLYLTDVHGLQLCRRLRAAPATKGLPVLFMTGKERDEAVFASVKDAGGADCLWKPFEPAALVAKVRALLGGPTPAPVRDILAARPPVTAVWADADGAARAWWARALAEQGFTLAAAATVEEALAACRRDPPDAVLTELAVARPDDGLDLLRLLRADADPALRALPAAVVTAHDSPEARLAALMAGADDVVAKDSDPAALAARVRARLTRVRASTPRGVRRAGAFLDAGGRVFYDPGGGSIRLSPQEAAVLRRLMDAELEASTDVLIGALGVADARAGEDPRAARLKRRHHAHEIVRRLRARLPRGAHRIAGGPGGGYRWLDA